MADDRLLEGEDPNTTYSEDAHHWMGVYGELLGFKEKLLETADRNISELTDSAARYEAAATDMTVLKAEHERLERRLQFWRRRYRELSKKGS